MGEQIIRRRRRSNLSNVLKSNRPDSSHPTESPELKIEPNSNFTSSIEPNINQPDRASDDNNVDLIRSELLEDTHHSDIAESNYSDDTHDWGWDNPEISNEYWHFLGRYE